ncbi:MAG: hypothetical protein KAV87_66605 [Desulfobacteraceae bacterium]|nr:hypothetical protein [Desulfobacteraceae bacterium]
MTLRYGLKTAADLYAKLQRDAQRLDDTVDSDRFFNFVMTASHLRQWIENDPSVAREVRSRLGHEAKSDMLAICTDIANASKHFAARPTKVTDVALSIRGFGAGRFGKGKFGIGEETITIKLKDGTEINALDLVAQVLDLYARVFGKDE